MRDLTYDLYTHCEFVGCYPTFDDAVTAAAELGIDGTIQHEGECVPVHFA